jgi:hypothetical protein
MLEAGLDHQKVSNMNVSSPTVADLPGHRTESQRSGMVRVSRQAWNRNGLVTVLLAAAGWLGLVPAMATPVTGAESPTAATTVSAGSRVQSHFLGLTDFQDWSLSSRKDAGSSRKDAGSNDPASTRTWLSPEIRAPSEFDEFILSWNISRTSLCSLDFAARAVSPEHSTRFYSLGVWSTDRSRGARHSVRDQHDADGQVLTDTLVLKRKYSIIQIRVTVSNLEQVNEPPARAVPVRFLGLSFLDSKAPTRPRSVRPQGWGQQLDVPRRCQRTYESEGGRVWCSPTSVSMVLAYWARELNRPELDQRVPVVAHSVYDPKWPGTGNWPFNTAFAGSFPGIVAYVDRLEDLSTVEHWVHRGVPVIASVVRRLLDGEPPRQSGGHLVVCIGFTPDGDVIINDPWADPADLKTVERVISRANFVQAWQRSQHAAYLIYPVALWPRQDENSQLQIEED